MLKLEAREQLEQFREELLLLARLNAPTRLQGKVDASDIVQQTLLKAHDNREQFRGETVEELAGWLRRILTNVLVDTYRTFTGKRDVALERSLEVSMDQSSANVGALLQAQQSSPSAGAIRREEVCRLIEALSELPDDQRTAIELHHLQSMPVSEVSRWMDRSEASVAGLLRRGLKALRFLLTSRDC